MDLQRRYDMVTKTRQNDAMRWEKRIAKQGVWSPTDLQLETSKKGAKALPMPVTIAKEEMLAPFFDHLAKDGTYENDESVDGKSHVISEPFYGVQALEFPMGVLYEDGRLDLCKQVVGPDHIGSLMNSLRGNSFVKHFLLGNNIIGPVGAQAIADFIADRPSQMETWYLAGNCINAPAFRTLVDAMVEHDDGTIRNVWLKRNPLGVDSAADVARLIKGCRNLRTLDLDQTELGDEGVAAIFSSLAQHTGPLALRNIYLSGDGVSAEAATALGRFLASKHCRLESAYMSSNPLTDAGALALAEHLPRAHSLRRLLLQSTGLGSAGARAICQALGGHAELRLLDLGQAFATQDLAAGYNFIADGAVGAIVELVQTAPRLEYLNLGYCPVAPEALSRVADAVAESPAMLYYSAAPIASTPGGADGARRLAARPRGRLGRNVAARYGPAVAYGDFLDDQKRWLVSDERDVRVIDSVYRTRDMGLARRGQLVLAKGWDRDDGTLERVMAQGPACAVRGRAVA